MAQDVRWIQRLQHFERALGRLNEALESEPAELSELEMEGVVQRFEYTFELAWKCLKDYLVWSGQDLIERTPRHVIKVGASVGIVEDGQTWIDMLERRNLLSHTYNEEMFEAAVVDLRDQFGHALRQLARFLAERRDDP